MKKIYTALFLGGFLFVSLFLKSIPAYADTMEYEDISITTDGTIHVLDTDENILYIGGQFSTVQINGGNETNRSNIAAIYLGNKTITDWAPDLQMEVHALEFTPNSILVKNYTDTENIPEENKQQLVINKTTAEITEINSTTPTEIPTNTPVPLSTATREGDMQVNQSELGFRIPTLSDILTFAVRGFFTLAGLTALFYLLLGAFNWITSGGDKDAVQAARDKMQAAVLGVLMMVAVLAIVWTLEQVVFKQAICFGISCPVSLPTLIEPTP